MTIGVAAATYSAQLAGRDPAAPAVVTESATWTTAELWARAAAAADWLDEVGVPAGGLVPAITATSADALALSIGALGSGRVLAPLGTRLTVRELAACVEGLEAPVLVADAGIGEAAAAVAAETGRRLAPLPEFARSRRALDFGAEPDSVAMILHTSGTSGLPKQVQIRQDRLATRVRANSALMGFDAESIYASATGFHHIAGLGMFVVALGSGAAVAPYARFSIDAWRGLEARGVTHTLIVPTIIEMLLGAGELHSRHLQVLQYGSSPIHPETLRATVEALPGVRLIQMFGQTEGSPISILTPDDHLLAASGRPDLLRSVGRAAPGVELRIEAPDADGVGEVLARAEYLFKVDEEGWLHSGDLGRLDGDGYLYLVGRRGDKIISGGENIYPVEVEQVLARHPAVRDVAVVGVLDRYWGEVVKAVLVVADRQHAPSEEELRVFCRRQLAGIKVPVVWEFRDELPRSPSGKILRRLLQEPAP